ncbi:MAG: hypothetical protein ACOCV8_02325, partial [Spirochaetota bacterium]
MSMENSDKEKDLEVNDSESTDKNDNKLKVKMKKDNKEKNKDKNGKGYVVESLDISNLANKSATELTEMAVDLGIQNHSSM